MRNLHLAYTIAYCCLCVCPCAILRTTGQSISVVCVCITWYYYRVFKAQAWMWHIFAHTSHVKLNLQLVLLWHIYVQKCQVHMPIQHVGCARYICNVAAIFLVMHLKCVYSALCRIIVTSYVAHLCTFISRILIFHNCDTLKIPIFQKL